MPRDARFWRNVSIIAVAHIAMIVALVGWSRATPKANLQSIVWMNGGGPEAVAQSKPPRTEAVREAIPPPHVDSTRSKSEAQDEGPIPTPAKSDIQLPVATPSPTPTLTPPPKPSVTPPAKASPKPTTKPLPKAPKKAVAPKATPRPSPRKQATPAEQDKQSDSDRKEAAKIAPANANSADGAKSDSIGSGAAVRASEFSWYGKMLHDRFYSEWIQPTTSVAVGAKISTLVRIRIENDGRISNFTIVRPSGNVVVDESVAAVAKRVTHVDPLPKGLASGAYYEVNINFELSPEG